MCRAEFVTGASLRLGAAAADWQRKMNVRLRETCEGSEATADGDTPTRAVRGTQAQKTLPPLVTNAALLSGMLKTFP